MVTAFTDANMYATSMAPRNVLKATVPDRRIWLPTPACVIVAVRLSKAQDAHSKASSNPHKNWKKAKEDKFCAEKLDAFLKLYKNEGNVDVRDMLSNSRKKSYIKQNSAETCNQCGRVSGRQKRISKKQDGRLVGRTPSFRGEYSQLFIHKLGDFLDYSNHKQFFLFKAFASITSAPPLRKILAAALAKVLNSNLISEGLCSRKLKLKKNKWKNTKRPWRNRNANKTNMLLRRSNNIFIVG